MKEHSEESFEAFKEKLNKADDYICTFEERYDLKIYYSINGTNDYTINVQTSSKVNVNGIPNTITRRLDNNGNIVSDRIYGPDGKALRDIDYDQHGNPGMHPWAPHIHDFKWFDDKLFDRN